MGTIRSSLSTFFTHAYSSFTSYTVLNPGQTNLIAVFLLASACLSLRGSGALGTGYNRPQLETKEILSPEANREATDRKVRRHWSKKVKIWVLNCIASRKEFRSRKYNVIAPKPRYFFHPRQKKSRDRAVPEGWRPKDTALPEGFFFAEDEKKTEVEVGVSLYIARGE